jgi:hypothetical protein
VAEERAWWEDLLYGFGAGGATRSVGTEFGRRALGMGQRLFGIVPTLDDEVTVEVTGQPGVTKQQLYFLALATANGIVRRFGELLAGDTPAFGNLVIEYDAANHWVRCTIGYSWSMSAMNADGTGTAIGIQYDRMAVYRGPQCDVVGGNFDFLLKGVPGLVPPGIPESSLSPDAPQLPFAGQPILTACPTTRTPTPKAITQNPAPSVAIDGTAGPPIPSPNPKPPGDNRSRGAVLGDPFSPASAGGSAVPGPTPTASGAKCCDKLRLLIPLVYSALSSPATDSEMRYFPPAVGPTGG